MHLWSGKCKREVCTQEIEKRGKSKDFEEEKQETDIILQKSLFDNLLNDNQWIFLMFTTLKAFCNINANHLAFCVNLDNRSKNKS